jgi:hypothetical protein
MAGPFAFLPALLGKGGTAGAAAAAGAPLVNSGIAAAMGAGKVAAGAGAAGAAAGGGGLASLLGGGAAGGAAGGALGMLSNPYVAFGLGSMLPTLLGGGGGDDEQAADIPESFSDQRMLSPPPPNVDIPTPGGDIFRPGISPEQRYFEGRYYSGGGMVGDGNGELDPGMGNAVFATRNNGLENSPIAEELRERIMGKAGGAGLPASFSGRDAASAAPAPASQRPMPSLLNSGPYRPGIDPERMHFARGGMLRNFARPQMMGSPPIRLAEGGIATLAEAEAGPEAGGPPPGPEQQQLVLEAARVIKGSSDADPRMVLGQFVAAFGEEALQDLIGRVESGQMDPVLEEAPPGAGTPGMLEGQGDGMSDEIPATVDGQQDVLLSDGEFVIPADVVSGLGNGSSEAGARQLEAMMAKVRQSRTGTQRQAPPIDPRASMPV